MPVIVVKTSVSTAFEVPEGVPIERIRLLAMDDLSDLDELTDEVICHHDKVMNQVFIGSVVPRSCSVESSIAELPEQPLNPA